MKKRIWDKYAAFFMGAGAILLLNRYKQKKANNTKGNKYFLYYDVLNKWMKQKEQGISVAEKLERQNIHEVAIYGMGDLGKHLVYELTNAKITVKYAIDRSFFAVSDLDVYLPDSELPNVDAIIVTAILDYESIRSNLEQKVFCPILSIADLFNTIET